MRLMLDCLETVLKGMICRKGSLKIAEYLKI